MHLRLAAAALLATAALVAPAAAGTVWSQAPATSPWSQEWSPAVSPSAEPTSSPTPATPETSGARTDTGLCRPGEPLWVLYVGSWYAAKAIRGPDGQGRCLISYDGFGASYDEWVGPERLAVKEMGPVSPSPQPQPSHASGSSGAGPVALGTYECYTFDAGQLNYAYTDIIITSAQAYAVGAQGGSYTVSAGGALSFTGPMSNANGLYAIKSSGRPTIDVTFNGDARGSMTCAKRR